MHQPTEDFLPSASLSPLNTSTIDKIYDDATMYPFAESTADDYYSLTDMTYPSDDYKSYSTTTTVLTPLSPTLTGEELSNWKLNEVFHNIMDMEETPQSTTEETSMNMPAFEHEDFFRSGDLLAEAFSLDGFEMPNSSDAATQEVEKEPEAADLVPLPVFDIPSRTSSPEPTADIADPSEVAASSTVSTKAKPKVRKSTSKSKRSTLETLTVKPHETKKEAIRRVKNNEASRDFRSRKKYKLVDLLAKEEQLIAENRKMRADVSMIEEVVKVLKDGLISSAKGFRS